MKRFYTLCICSILCLSFPVSSFAETNKNNLELSIKGENVENTQFSQLKKDLEKINNIPEEELSKFINDNSEWLEDVNNRLANYMNNIPLEQQETKLKELNGLNPNVKYDTRYYFFDSYSYTFRNGYQTYNLVPKASVRTLKYMADNAWNSLSEHYINIKNDDGGLYNQYICHYYAIIEYEWNIEKGRPNVGLPQTIKEFCNT